MAIISVEYVCGCGFRTRKIEEASVHCDSRAHVITSINGTIRPTPHAVEHAEPQFSTPVDPEAVAHAAAEHARYETMKARLGKRA